MRAVGGGLRALSRAADTFIKPSILDLPSMPMASPSYPRGPYRFVQREDLIVTYL